MTGTLGGRGRLAVALTVAYIALNLSAAAYYVSDSINSPSPTVLGLSAAFAYSILVWIGLMVVVYLSYRYVWG